MARPKRSESPTIAREIFLNPLKNPLFKIKTGKVEMYTQTTDGRKTKSRDKCILKYVSLFSPNFPFFSRCLCSCLRILLLFNTLYDLIRWSWTCFFSIIDIWNKSPPFCIQFNLVLFLETLKHSDHSTLMRLQSSFRLLSSSLLLHFVVSMLEANCLLSLLHCNHLA